MTSPRSALDRDVSLGQSLEHATRASGTCRDIAHTVHGGPEAAAAAGCVVPPPEQMPEHRDFKLFNTYCGQLRALLAREDVEKVGFNGSLRMVVSL